MTVTGCITGGFREGLRLQNQPPTNRTATHIIDFRRGKKGNTVILDLSLISNFPTYRLASLHTFLLCPSNIALSLRGGRRLSAKATTHELSSIRALVPLMDRGEDRGAEGSNNYHTTCAGLSVISFLGIKIAQQGTHIMIPVSQMKKQQL